MTDAWNLVEKVTKACNLFVAVLQAGEKLVEVWAVVEPFVEPLLLEGVFSPETFWVDGVKKAKTEMKAHAAQLELVRDQYKQIAEPKAQSNYADYLVHKTPEELDALDDAYDRLTAALYAKYPQVVALDEVSVGHEGFRDQIEQAPETVDQTLSDAVNAADLLLAYAAEKGGDVDQQLVETIVCTKHTLKVRALKMAEESAFWEAYRKLCIATEPVSRESLEATNAQSVRRMWFGTRNVSVASSAVRYYQRVTIISILVLLVAQIYWVFVQTLVTDLTRIRSELIEMKVAVVAKEAEMETLKSSVQDTETIDAKTKEQIRKLENELAPGLTEQHPKRIELLNQYKSNITLLEQTNVLGMVFYASAQEDLASYESQPLQIKTGAISLEVMSLYLLPILYGLVGACAYILRTISQQIKARTFTNASKIRLQLRMVLGALAGLSIAWFATGDGGVSVLESITPLALAFLAGYSVELVFSAMDTFIEAFTRERITE